MGLEIIGEALKGTGAAVHKFIAPPKSKPPYIIYAPDGADDFNADGRHAEKTVTGTIDLYTGNEEEPLFSAVESALESVAVVQTAIWYLNSVQYETESGTQTSGYTGLIHYEWVFQIGGR